MRILKHFFLMSPWNKMSNNFEGHDVNLLCRLYTIVRHFQTQTQLLPSYTNFMTWLIGLLDGKKKPFTLKKLTWSLFSL